MDKGTRFWSYFSICNLKECNYFNIFVALLHACVSLVALQDDRQVEIQIFHYNYHFDIFVDSSLIDMYTT